MVIACYNSPCGKLRLGAWLGKLCLCDWVDAPHHDMVIRRICRLTGASLVHSYREDLDMSVGICDGVTDGSAEGARQVVDWAASELDEYFEGRRREFSVPLLLPGTDFQQRVWEALLAIPYGRTESYGALAGRIGAASGVRAVATAVGANALSVFLPCHRVVGADGALTGYAGGLEAKQYLLGLEARR